VESIHEHGLELARFTADSLRSIPGMRVFGRQADGDGAVVSFLHDTMHANDLAVMLDAQGFAVRTGHHCAQPLLRRFDIAATNRASFWLYNTLEEASAFVEATRDICQRYS
jgi:cysteine desulfurase/selenocysteine lyase